MSPCSARIMLNLYERQLQVNVVIPDGVEHTVVRFDWFALDAGAQHVPVPIHQSGRPVCSCFTA
jgi:hypothetical protein